jgi:hypothetical protein
VIAYYGATGPATFGATTGGAADAGEGDVVGMTTSGTSSFVVIYVEPGDNSGVQLTSSATYDNQTLASLGLTPGVYSYTRGTGDYADSFTIQIGSLGSIPPAPEASTWIMMLVGFGGLGAAALTRDRRAGTSLT